ncbi:MAG: metal ABC transporter substrate-binding protein [Syntrophales bacterium]|nr:metal ABC transporter substrate-binding protein [Syntrophales bacterium]
MKKPIFAFLLTLMLSTPAVAELNVVATLPWIGSLAGELGSDRVRVTVLVKPSQDPHFIEAKPSMILAARNADILMYNGLDLEIGYLPRVIESSTNPGIQPGRPGNLDCSQFIQVIEKPATVDRSMGDVHPLGNPHYHLSTRNMLGIARGMTQALADKDPAHKSFYRTNLASFEARLKEKQKEWAKINLKGKRFVAYHRFFEYLAREYGFRIVAYVEPKPGIPPSAGHIEELVELMKKTKPDGIMTTGYFGSREINALSRKTGVKAIIVPHDVGSVRGVSDWFSLMDAVLTSLK